MSLAAGIAAAGIAAGAVISRRECGCRAALEFPGCISNAELQQLGEHKLIDCTVQGGIFCEVLSPTLHMLAICPAYACTFSFITLISPVHLSGHLRQPVEQGAGAVACCRYIRGHT